MFHLREQFLFMFNAVVDLCIFDSPIQCNSSLRTTVNSAAVKWTFDG